MNAELDAALAECDERGVSLWLSAGNISFRAGELGFPDSLRESLRKHRAELTELLRSDGRPDPEFVPFIARNCDVRWEAFGLVRTVPYFLVSERPYYRLTPSVWVRFCQSVDWLCASILSDPIASGEARAAAALLIDLGLWVGQHYRHDHIRRAWHNPHPLPVVPKSADVQEPERTKLPAKQCHKSPKASGCDRGRRQSKIDRQPALAGMTETGSASER